MMASVHLTRITPDETEHVDVTLTILSEIEYAAWEIGERRPGSVSFLEAIQGAGIHPSCAEAWYGLWREHYDGDGPVVEFCGDRRHADIVRPAEIVEAPAAWLSRMLRLLCSKRAFEREVLPTFEDFWTEYFEALSEGDKWRLRAVVARGYWSVFTVLGLGWVVRVLKLLADLRSGLR